MNENELSTIIIGCAIEVHKELGGPGLLERVYEEALAYELISKGLKDEAASECSTSLQRTEIISPVGA